MSDILVNKKIMKAEKEKAIMGKRIELVDFRTPVLSGKINRMSQEEMFKAINGSADHVGNIMSMNYSGKYGTPYEGSGFNVPMKWGDGKTMTAREKINSGAFMSGNTLPVDWDNLWDAFRMDISVRKAAMPTIREFFYDVTTNPAFTRTMNPTEIDPFGIVFEENNGHGQAISQGETLGGGYDSITQMIYAAGFTWDLMAALFDRTITPERIMDAVMVGYNAKLDDIAMSPIINFSYSGVQQTGPNTTSGVGRQELLYLTLEDTLDDLGDREHPVTGRKISVTDVVVLASPYDARHIARVARGLQNTNEEKYPGLTEIRNVVEYDGEDIVLRDRTVSYSGVTSGTAYMAVPAGRSNNEYMKIARKADLTVEIDQRPDVKTLSQEERAYWFCEAIYYKGIQYFVQEITLPSW
jgi:hypothetical protein